MSYVLAAILVFLAVVVAVPGIVLGVAVLAGGRPRVLRRGEPGIHTFLMLAVLAVVAVAAAFLLPWAVAFSGLPHAFTGVEGLFLAVLALLGLGYAWRRGVLRWQ